MNAFIDLGIIIVVALLVFIGIGIVLTAACGLRDRMEEDHENLHKRPGDREE